MVSTLFSALLLVAGHLSLSTAQANPAFVGSGYIHVLNGSDITKASIADRIGCMDKTGAFTLSDCAVFTRMNSGLFSSAGNCTFHDPSQPENLDSAYGRMSTAWHCTSGPAYQDAYYSFVSRHISSNLSLQPRAPPHINASTESIQQYPPDLSR
jgi:hypothetical protein